MDRFHGRDHKLIGKISENLQGNIIYVREVLKECSDLIQKEFHI